MSDDRVNNSEATINECISIYIYLVFASITATVQLVVFVCFASQQYFININNVNTSSIKIMATMAAFLPSTTRTQSDNGNRDILSVDGQL